MTQRRAGQGGGLQPRRHEGRHGVGQPSGRDLGLLVQLSDANTGRPLAAADPPDRHRQGPRLQPRRIAPGHGRLQRRRPALGHDHRRSGRPAPAQANLVLALAFSPDGTKLAVGTTNDRGRNNSQVRLWDLTTHQPIGAPMRHQDSGSTTVVTFSPDGGTLLSVSHDGLTWLWDARSHSGDRPADPPSDRVPGAVIRGDSRAVLTGTNDGTARLWDLRTGEPLSPPVNRPSAATALRWSRRRRVRRRLRRWDDPARGTSRLAGRSARRWSTAARSWPSPSPRRPHAALGRQHGPNPEPGPCRPRRPKRRAGSSASSGPDRDGARAWPVDHVSRPGNLEGTAPGGRGPIESGEAGPR